MDKERFETGLEIRKSVLGREFVEKAFRECGRLQRRAAGVGDGVLMGRGVGAPGAGQKTRSLLNLAMISSLNRPHELKMHVAGALRNGEVALVEADGLDRLLQLVVRDAEVEIRNALSPRVLHRLGNLEAFLVKVHGGLERGDLLKIVGQLFVRLVLARRVALAVRRLGRAQELFHIGQLVEVDFVRRVVLGPVC